MMSVLFVGLGAHLRAGISVWQRATAKVDVLQRQRLALNRLERDLSNAIVYDPREESYGTEGGKLPWPQFGDGALAYFTVSASAAEQPPAVRFVTYRCEEIDGTPGLWRTSQFVGEARTIRHPPPELILPNCEGLSFQYAFLPGDESEPIAWRAEWSNAQAALPPLVEASVRLGSGAQVKRLCAIPAGVWKPIGPPP
jgi:hypothetical protein